MKSLVERADISLKEELEKLLAGGRIEKPIHEEITYDSVYDSEENLWNFLFFTGYLKQTGRRMEQETQYITMEIPNLEVRYIYKNTIGKWFRDKVKVKDFLVKSNRESGNGRLDIVVRSLDVNVAPVVIELKVSDTFKGMDTACDEALRQIKDQGYDSWLPEEGYTEVWNYGISFFRKQCKVKAEHCNL